DRRRQDHPRRRSPPADQDDGSGQARVVHAHRTHRRRLAREARHRADPRGPADHAPDLRARAPERGRLPARHAEGVRPRDRGSAARGHHAPEVRQGARRPRGREGGRRDMSIARTARALPTLLRVGVAETVAYRAEFLVWILTTTLPLVMLGLWTSVADEA